MNNIIKDIKQQYFTSQNINFICDILQNNYTIEINKDKLFKIQNNIFNNFLERMHDKDIDIQQLNNILVELNKLTIQLYLTPENQIEQIQTIEPELIQILSSNSSQHLSIESSQLKDLIKELVTELKNSVKEPTDTIKEVKEIKEIIKSMSDESNLSKSSQQISEPSEPSEKKYIYLDLYSYSSKYDKHQYEFTFDIPLQNFILKDFKIYSNDAFNNINEHNNKIQLIENTSKITIIIPQGNYNIQNLVNIIEQLINNKSVFKSYKIVYDKNKNRVKISNEKNFNIIFIENEVNNIQLKDILGFTKNEYSSNNIYSSENETNDDIYKEIYIKNNNSELNNFYTNLSIQEINNENILYDESFKYFYKNTVNINDYSFKLKKPINNMILQLYYKSNNKIIKFIKKVDFNILLKVELV